jgi:hypothetical protein
MPALRNAKQCRVEIDPVQSTPQRDSTIGKPNLDGRVQISGASPRTPCGRTP